MAKPKINKQLTKICVKNFKMKKTYSPMEFKRKTGKFYLTVNKFNTPITSLPLLTPKTHIYSINNDITELNRKIEKLKTKVKRLKQESKNKKTIKARNKIKAKIKEIRLKIETKESKLKNRDNLRKLYNRIEKRIDKLATKNGYTKNVSIDKQPIWMKAISNNTISIISLLV